MSQSKSRYSAVAIILHWVMALLIIFMISMGLWMHDAIKVQATQMLAFETYQLHKSIGLTLLILTVLRLIWRITHRAPPLPEHMGRWERVAATLSHGGFYLLMLALPLSGWAMVSVSPYGLPTIIFGLFEWPHIAPLEAMANKEAAEALFKDVHELLAFGTIGLLALHIGAALKHHWIDRDDVLARMLPFLRKHP
jgi:cytochrome b561